MLRTVTRMNVDQATKDERRTRMAAASARMVRENHGMRQEEAILEAMARAAVTHGTVQDLDQPARVPA